MLQDGLVYTGYTAGGVYVFDAHQPLPVVCPSVKPAGEGCNERARMQRARGGGSESTDVRQLQTFGRLANSQSELEAGHKRIFDAMAQVPIAAGTQAGGCVVLV